MKKLYVRVAKKGVEKFHRCGYHFTSAWIELTNVDDATERRLREEQMLEVSDVTPDGFEPTASGASAILPAHGGDLEDVIVFAVGGKLNNVDLHGLIWAVSVHVDELRKGDGEVINGWISACESQVKQIDALNAQVAALHAELKALKDTSPPQQLPEVASATSGGEFDAESVLAHAKAAISGPADVAVAEQKPEGNASAPTPDSATVDPAPAVQPADAGVSDAAPADAAPAPADDVGEKRGRK